MRSLTPKDSFSPEKQHKQACFDYMQAIPTLKTTNNSTSNWFRWNPSHHKHERSTISSRENYKDNILEKSIIIE